MQGRFSKAIKHHDTFPPIGQEAANLAALRLNLAIELAKIGETMPEKTSDFKLLRFLRGNKGGVCPMRRVDDRANMMISDRSALFGGSLPLPRHRLRLPQRRIAVRWRTVRSTA